MRIHQIVILLGLSSRLVPAANSYFETRQSFAAVVYEKKGWEIELDSQVRSSRRYGAGQQVRLGVEWARRLAPKWSLVGGYWMRHRRTDTEAFIPTVHRVNVGVERTFRLPASVRLTSRTLAERWLRPGAADNNRYRQRMYFSYPRRYTPFSAVEVFADERGLSILRFANGVAWRPVSQWKVQLWYAYDHRPAWRSDTRHVLTTSFTWYRRSE